MAPKNNSKGKAKAKAATDEEGSASTKLKAATSINVRHILVCPSTRNTRSKVVNLSQVSAGA